MDTYNHQPYELACTENRLNKPNVSGDTGFKTIWYRANLDWSR